MPILFLEQLKGVFVYKDLEKRKQYSTEYHKKWYSEHPEGVARKNARKKERRQEIREWYKDYKRTLKCSICGEDNPACLSFHHKDDTEKEIGIAKMVQLGYSIESIKAEIAKCVVHCMNCHFKLHHSDKF